MEKIYRAKKKNSYEAERRAAKKAIIRNRDCQKNLFNVLFFA
jgi:hypothetical protein